MKKWLGTICSAAVAVLTFVFLSIPQFVSKSDVLDVRQTCNLWDFFTEENSVLFEEISGYGFYKFAAIALIVVACLLAVWAVVLLLKNLGVLKLKFNLALVNNILLAVAFVLAVCALIALFVMGGDMLEGAPAALELYAGPSWGAFLNVGFAAVAAACGWIFARE